MKKTLLSCAAFIFLSTPALAAFPDVPDSHPYKDAISWLQQEGFIQGFSDGTFRPEQKITRAEFTKILLLSKFSPDEVKLCDNFAFDDSEVGAWYASYLCFAHDEGIVNGYPDNTFKPHRNINYAEAAKIMVNTLVGVQKEGNGENWWKPFADVLEDKDAVPAAIKGGEHPLTRGEMAYMIYELNGAPALDNSTDTPLPSASPTTTPATADETQAEYTSEKNTLSFIYKKGYDTENVTYPTTIIERDAQIIVAAEKPEADFAACVESGLCIEQDGKKYAFLDSVYVLAKGKDDTDLEAAIVSKVVASGKDFAACRLVEVDDAAEGWTKFRVEPNEYTSFLTDGNGGYSDAEGKKLTLYEVSRLKDQESTEKCGIYASGFGKSFFLTNATLSENRFLFVPAYGVEHLIDHASLRFE